MAKKPEKTEKAGPAQESFPPNLKSHTAPAPAPAPAPVVAPVAPPAPTHWEVQLNAPTPVAFSPLVVEAANEHDAKRKFLEVNGIDHSNHPFTVKPAVQ